MSALEGLENCPLHQRTPYGMTGVSLGYFSIARHYGACEFNGDRYIYMPDDDELIREDVLKWKQQKVRSNK